MGQEAPQYISDTKNLSDTKKWKITDKLPHLLNWHLLKLILEMDHLKT